MIKKTVVMLLLLGLFAVVANAQGLDTSNSNKLLVSEVARIVNVSIVKTEDGELKLTKKGKEIKETFEFIKLIKDEKLLTYYMAFRLLGGKLDVDE